jgi:hypothetical protein
MSNLGEADFQPGQLRLPLTVVERSGVHRRGVVVTGGVPFPAGFLPDANRLKIVDQTGRAIPSQATVMTRWWKPRYDNSVRWALVSFPADVPASGTATYFLTDRAAAANVAWDSVPSGSGRSPNLRKHTRLRVERTPEAILVATGNAEFTVPNAGTALLSRAAINGKNVLGPTGLRGEITSGKWEEQGLSGGERMQATFAVDGVTIEESGPVRVVVAIKGTHTPGSPKTGKHYDFTARLYFTANSPSVRVIYTLRNGRLDPELYDGKRRTYVWPIEDASLLADLSLRGSAGASCLAEGETVNGDALTVYQDSSGGDKWKQLGGGNYERWLAKFTAGREVPGVRFRGYQVTSNGKTLVTGNDNPGVLSVSGSDAGIAAALRNFRVEYPSALAGSPNELRIGLFPGEFADPFWLEPGQRKSWDIRLTLYADPPPPLSDLHAEHESLLLFRVPPAWMTRAQAWTTPLPAQPASNNSPTPPWDKRQLDGIDVGWDWHGWISSWNAGGGHWNQSTCFGKWVLWGDGDEFDRAEARTLWAADATPMHFDDPDLATFWLMLRSWNWRENRLVNHTFPNHYERTVWGLPDSGHMAMFMWFEYYYLTGDMRAREACDSLGTRARAFCWQYNHDDKNDGTGPLPRAINWCAKRDPDIDPSFRLATRYVGWPLYDLACWYELTGDERLAAECRTVARAFRNTARMSPIGFMVLQINAKDDRSVYGGQGPFEPMRSKSASQCYAHFQEGIMTTGLAKYYRETGDVEALDTMIGFADLMCHHAMLRDETDRRLGWTYAFGDYWGPYRVADVPDKQRISFMSSNFRVVQPLGQIYQFTGRKDYWDVLRDAVTTLQEPNLTIAAAHCAVEHPHTDRTPPAAVTDLAARAIGNGRIQLTWTAPGGDGTNGQAAWYQVKYSQAKIVERVDGWPDLTDPLPIDEWGWHARASAFNNRQRAFWAADNIDGEPAPSPAGTRETCVLEELQPGTCYFALKTWDNGPNMSGLSNVARVDVE